MQTKTDIFFAVHHTDLDKIIAIFQFEKDADAYAATNPLFAVVYWGVDPDIFEWEA